VQFAGQFERTLDDKGRVVLPARLREGLDDGRALITDFGNRLCIWPADEFARYVDDLTEDLQAKVEQGEFDDAYVNETIEFLWESAQPIKADTQGRIVVPDELLTDELRGSDVVVTGARDRIYIYPAGEYRARHTAAKPKVAVAVSMHKPRRRT